MKKSIALIAFLLIACQLFALAAFSDMGDSRWDWARPAVESMTEDGYIKGYDDNTFRPQNPVSNMESVLLISRILGVEKSEASPFVREMINAHNDFLKPFIFTYETEVAFLLHRGVVTEKEISNLLSDKNINTPLKRVVAAKMLTRLCGGEAEALKEKNPTLDYKDAGLIAAEDLPYIGYVTKHGIMKGMEDNTFSGNTEVTRAQMAVLLSRILESHTFALAEGSIANYDVSKKTVAVSDANNIEKTYDYSGAEIYIDGDKITGLTDVPLYSQILVTLRDSKPVWVDIISLKIDETIEGIFKSYVNDKGDITVSIANVSSGIVTEYPLADRFKLTLDGKNVSISDIPKESIVSADVYEDEIIGIRATTATTTLSCTVNEIQLEPEFRLFVKTSEGKILEMEVVPNVRVKRNGKTATLADVLIGDSLKATVTYNVITSIEATSTNRTVKGTIDAIKISASPYISIKESDGTVTEFALLRSVTLLRGGKEADIYSLRLNEQAKVTVESDTVTQIEITESEVSTTLRGTVEAVNTSYGYIKLAGVSELIFTKNAKISDKTGATRLLKEIKEGMSITAFGTIKLGGFEATLIIIN